MPDLLPLLKANLQSVQARIAQACERSGRPREAVTLIAVTKYAALEWIEVLVSLGQRELGENRPQQLLERSAKFTGNELNWHLIGHLQSNKAKRILPVATWIHSVDSLKLVTSIDRFAGELDVRPKLLVEVNVTGEVSKDGFTSDELRRDWDAICACRNVDLVGMMTMAPIGDQPEAARPAFRALRLLRDELQVRSPSEIVLSQLSMGMTGDFEVAIEEGATLVRIGSALFEGLE